MLFQRLSVLILQRVKRWHTCSSDNQLDDILQKINRCDEFRPESVESLLRAETIDLEYLVIYIYTVMVSHASAFTMDT